MRITSCKFVKSVANGAEIINDGKPIIAFVGRSNVGKSSLLNFLVNNKSMARTSSTPGRTRLINYFQINDNMYFVDLPGYGFAKLNRSESAKWDTILGDFLTKSEDLKLVCILVDSRLEASELDKSMMNYLEYFRIPYILIATKCDKMSKAQQNNAKLKLANSLAMGVDNILMSSAKNKSGKEEILIKFEQFINEE
ncbi:MAG: YihA family ribosome biogenesis GTP-binding protein [Clostridiales bacterium]|nr:YihA family ribosome biogenesis GTP-binding protein [Clostridiales bacterium]